MGKDPMDESELSMCETVGKRVVPTAATVLSRPDRAPGTRSSIMSKMNYMLMLHGNSPLPFTSHCPLLLTF